MTVGGALNECRASRPTNASASVPAAPRRGRPGIGLRLSARYQGTKEGLSRYDPDSETTADYIVVEMARHLLGENWMPEFVEKARRGGIERVLL